MLASSLLYTIAESNKRELSGWATPVGLRVANESLAKGLTMPTTDSIQIKPRDAGRLFMLLPYSSEWVAKSKTVVGRWRHQQEQHGTVPQTNEAITYFLALFSRKLSYTAAFVCQASPGRRLCIRTVQNLLEHTDVRTTMINVDLHITPMLCRGYQE